MTVETFERDGINYRLLFGFGRLQKAHYFIYSFLPESLKRAQAAGGELEESDFKKVTPEEILDYNSKLAPALAKLVLDSATDWDKSKMTVDEYVDSYLAESAGLEISQRIKTAASVQTLSEDDKKKS